MVNFKKIFLSFLFIASASPAHAMVFPSDSVNIRGEITGNVTAQLVHEGTGQTHTILYESINSTARGNDDELILYCGTERLLYLKNFATLNAIERWKFAKCHDDILITTANISASDMVTYSIIFVDRDISTTLDPLSDLTATVVSTSTSPLFVQDAGNLSFLLTILISLMFLMVVGFLYNNMTNKKPWH